MPLAPARFGKVKISPEYLALQRQFHVDRPDYGSYGSQWAEKVEGLCLRSGMKTVLDYGCGKGTFKRELDALSGGQSIVVTEYDPAIPGKDAPPEPAECVVCVDVLEHVEEQFVPEVIADLRRLATDHLVVAVHCGPAGKTLPDGRNAHITQHTPKWWLEVLEDAGFVLRYFGSTPGGFVAVMT